MIKAIVVFALLAIACSGLEVEDVNFIKTGSPAVSKFDSWKVSNMLFVGGSSWDAASVTHSLRPQQYQFNVSANPYPVFAVQDINLVGTEVGQTTTIANVIYKYWRHDVAAGFGVHSSSASIAGPSIGYAIESSNTLKNQRVNFYSCAIYKSATNAITNKGCATFSLAEWNADMPNQNTSIAIAGFGTLYVNLNYVHANQQTAIPSYISSIKVNKMRFWSQLSQTEPTILLATAQIGGFATGAGNLVGGNVFKPSLTGFYISGYENPATTTTWALTNTDRLTATLHVRTGAATTTPFTWTARTQNQFSNLIQYCGRTVNLVSSNVEVEVEVSCTSASLIKLALAAFAMIAGLFML